MFYRKYLLDLRRKEKKKDRSVKTATNQLTSFSEEAPENWRWNLLILRRSGGEMKTVEMEKMEEIWPLSRHHVSPRVLSNLERKLQREIGFRFLDGFAGNYLQFAICNLQILSTRTVYGDTNIFPFKETVAVRVVCQVGIRMGVYWNFLSLFWSYGI